jgi:hypothetical protein
MSTDDRVAAYRMAATLHRSSAEYFDKAAGYAQATNDEAEAAALEQAQQTANEARKAGDAYAPIPA